MAEVIKNTLRKWDTAEALARELLSDDDYDPVYEALRGDGTRVSDTVHGRMFHRLIVRDANGRQVPFPLEIAVEATFDGEGLRSQEQPPDSG